MSTVLDDLSDLERFDDTFQPAEPMGFRPGLDIVPDGEHDFTILDAELTRTPKAHERILRVGLGVGTTGQIVERTYFLSDHDAVARLGADLVLLGFDADKWTPAHGRKLSVELPKAVERMPGKRFRATKKTNAKDGKTYHNLYISSLLAAGTPPLPKSAPASAPTPSHAEELPPNPFDEADLPF